MINASSLIRLTAVAATAFCLLPRAVAEQSADFVILTAATEEASRSAASNGEHDIYDLLYSAIPADEAAPPRISFQPDVQPAHFQDPSSGPAPQAQPEGAGTADDAITSLQLDLAKNPCAAMIEKPMGQLGIGIGMAGGKLPDDHARACWNQVNAQAGPYAFARYWPQSVFNWDATCLCHRPLYFEEINLERHGYGCCECVQPAVSAAHFFATVPVLPYCIATDCPGECQYTLGHYRPGSCPPWRHHWPPCDPVAAAAEGGVLTGLIFLIP